MVPDMRLTDLLKYVTLFLINCFVLKNLRISKARYPKQNIVFSFLALNRFEIKRVILKTLGYLPEE